MLAWSLKTLLRESDSVRERSLVLDAYTAGLEAAAKVFDEYAISARCYGLDATKHEQMAAHIRALAPPREPTPSHADAPDEHRECPICDADLGLAHWFCPACGCDSFRNQITSVSTLCPEHAIRLPCPACKAFNEKHGAAPDVEHEAVAVDPHAHLIVRAPPAAPRCEDCNDTGRWGGNLQTPIPCPACTTREDA